LKSTKSVQLATVTYMAMNTNSHGLRLIDFDFGFNESVNFEFNNPVLQVDVKHNDDEFDWSKSVFQQTWPELDDNYNLKIKVKAMDEDLIEIPVARWK
jgi:hypothetical protein